MSIGQQMAQFWKISPFASCIPAQSLARTNLPDSTSHHYISTSWVGSRQFRLCIPLSPLHESREKLARRREGQVCKQSRLWRRVVAQTGRHRRCSSSIYSWRHLGDLRMNDMVAYDYSLSVLAAECVKQRGVQLRLIFPIHIRWTAELVVNCSALL